MKGADTQPCADMSGAAARKAAACLVLAPCLGGDECRSKAVSAPSCFNSVARGRPSYRPTVGRMKAVSEQPVGEGVMRATGYSTSSLPGVFTL